MSSRIVDVLLITTLIRSLTTMEFPYAQIIRCGYFAIVQNVHLADYK